MDTNIPDGGLCGPGCHTRRSVLAGAGAAGVALLAGCATYNGNPQGQQNQQNNQQQAGNGGLPKVSQIPVGGGVVVPAKDVVLTQPVAGTIKAFSATCTHQGCTVASVDGGTINCPCHGSKFHITDGSVANGPAASPLPAKNVTVSGDTITLS
jgi:Rieske Fe-S protein